MTLSAFVYPRVNGDVIAGRLSHKRHKCLLVYAAIANTCNVSLTQEFFSNSANDRIQLPRKQGNHKQHYRKNRSTTTKTFKRKQFTALDPDAKVIKSIQLIKLFKNIYTFYVQTLTIKLHNSQQRDYIFVNSDKVSVDLFGIKFD